MGEIVNVNAVFPVAVSVIHLNLEDILLVEDIILSVMVQKNKRLPFPVLREPFILTAFFVILATIGLLVVFPLYKAISFPVLKDYLAYFGRER